MTRPTLTASGEIIYGEAPEDGILAKVYGDPELAKLFAAAPDLLETLDDICKHAVANNHGSFNISTDRVYLARELVAKATS